MEHSIFNKKFTIIYIIVSAVVLILASLPILLIPGLITFNKYLISVLLPNIILSIVIYFALSMYLFGKDKLKIISIIIGVSTFLLCNIWLFSSLFILNNVW